MHFLFLSLVPIAIIAAFKRMKKLTQDHSFISAALRESSLLVRYRSLLKCSNHGLFLCEATDTC